MLVVVVVRWGWSVPYSLRALGRWTCLNDGGGNDQLQLCGIVS